MIKPRACRGWVGFLAGVAWLLAAVSAGAAQAGAWETFGTQANADGWQVYDYADNNFYPVDWYQAVAGDEFIYTNYTGDSIVEFYADAVAGGGALVGDYPAARVAGIGCEVFIGELAALEYLECALYANGPGGPRYYYSGIYEAADFAASGWYSLLFSFDVPWYYDDGTQWVEVSAKSLTAIEEIDFTFVPQLGSAGGSLVGIDNVTLEPTLVAPVVATAVTAGTPRRFAMAFTPGPGLACRVEKMRQSPAVGWDAVVGQTGLLGPGVHRFETPLTGAAEIFRVAAEAHYTPIVTP
jgi:hypothetical protein